MATSSMLASKNLMSDDVFEDAELIWNLIEQEIEKIVKEKEKVPQSQKGENGVA